MVVGQISHHFDPHYPLDEQQARHRCNPAWISMVRRAINLMSPAVRLRSFPAGGVAGSVAPGTPAQIPAAAAPQTVAEPDDDLYS